MALPTEKIIEELSELIRLDQDALAAFDEAIDAIQEPALREQLTLFRADHERHVQELSTIVRGYGGAPPDHPGVRGQVRKAMTKIAGLVGAEATLEAMKANEQLAADRYDHHAALDLPEDIREVVTRNALDERRHHAWVEDALLLRMWEQTTAPQP
jgi:uncharacterized protein (TIGR02284 family)